MYAEKMLIRPEEVHFSQDSISKYFDRRSKHGSQTVGQTLDQILVGNCLVSDIPKITVIKIRGYEDKWFSVDNRRLWVFKQLERLGYLDTIEVVCTTYNYYQHGRKITTNNGGTNIRIRGDGDPGGMGHSLPDKCYPKLQKVSEEERRKRVHSHVHRKEISESKTSGQELKYSPQMDVTNPASSTYSKEKYLASLEHEDLNEASTSLYSQHSKSYVKNSQSHYDGKFTFLKTSKNQKIPSSSSSKNFLPGEQYYHTSQPKPQAFEKYTYDASRLPETRSLFQRENKNVPFRNRSKTEDKGDMKFQDRFSGLKVTKPLELSHRYTDTSEKISNTKMKTQENNHPIYNKHAISNINEIFIDETKDGDVKLRIDYQTDSSIQKASEESETDKSVRNPSYTLGRSKAHSNSSNKGSFNISGSKTVLAPSRYKVKYLGESYSNDSLQKTNETSIDRGHDWNRNTETNDDYVHSCAVDRASYCRPVSATHDSRKEFGLKVKSSVSKDRHCSITRQQFAAVVPACSEEEVEMNMAKLLFRQRHQVGGAWSTEAVYGSSDDSS